jgi:hypothetical protein
MVDQVKWAPPPYTTLDVGASTVAFHTYILDANGRKIGCTWGPITEKVWTAALWAAAPELLEALQGVVADVIEYERVNNLLPSPGKQDCWQSVTRARAAIARVTGESNG